MTFSEAQKHLLNGEAIFRKAWNGEKKLEAKEGTNIFHITQEDMEANDWESLYTSKKVEINADEFSNADSIFNLKEGDK